MSRDKAEMLAELQASLRRSQKAYDLYCQNGRTFFFAGIIKGYNLAAHSAARDLLAIGPDSRVEALVTHLESWMTQWDQHAKELSPGDDSEFAFETKIKFPRAEVESLLNEGRTAS